MSARDDYPDLAWPRPFDSPIRHKEIANALDEIDRLRSWDGLMSVLDEHYPADVFDGSSGDPGPRIVVLLREINELRR